MWKATKVCDANGVVFGVTLDNNGTIYFTTNSQNVYHIRIDDAHNTPHLLVNIPNSKLRGIVWNGHNNMLYISDNNDKIHSYSIDTGKLTVIAGKKKALLIDTEFDYLRGIAMDKNGDLYVTNNHSVRKVNLSQGTITMAGSSSSGYKDGQAEDSLLHYPIGISVSEDTIYVADRDNDCVRKIKDGMVSTAAGGPEHPMSYPKSITVTVDGNLIVGVFGDLEFVYLNKGTRSIIVQDINAMSLVTVNRYDVVVGTESGVVLLTDPWKWKRWIWIGHLKENPNDCLLATLPRDIIKEIAQFM